MMIWWIILHAYKSTSFYIDFRLFLFKIIKHALSTFEAVIRLFHKHAEAQLKKVRAYKKKECDGIATNTW